MCLKKLPINAELVRKSMLCYHRVTSVTKRISFYKASEYRCYKGGKMYHGTEL